ncbi:MAG TPA: MarR family transcriptional regulator [Candidatus Nanopelagicales bacterium]|nr:MarR family transcriptional regulator [Candidatus Nanopelagicales bacterium]
MSARTREQLDTARLGSAVAALLRSTRREISLPLGASTIAALVTVEAQGPVRLGDLARHEGVAPATLSRIVALLDDEGYVVRTPDPDDRRSSWLEITAEGRALLDGVRREHARAMARRAERLTPAQSAQLAEALEALEALAAD